MTLIKCDKCGKTVSDTAKKCPHCGQAMMQKTNEKNKNTIKCKVCGRRYNASISNCPYCNEEKPSQEEKKYYKHLDLLRVIFCIAILLYHIGILKGGYLAVCSFFVLSSYLSCISAFKNNNFQIGKYYKSRLLKLYLPLVIVIFMTIPLISAIKDIIWINLRPETTSVLFGYNNFWQLNANLDYFARHVNSPFIHLWYIAILIQYEIIFPFLFLFLKKLGEKIHKIVPCIISFILAITGGVYFYISTFSDNIMVPYYSTFTRIFSLLFGLAFGFTHSYYGTLIPKKLKNEEKPYGKIGFYLYLLVTIMLFIFIKSDSVLFPASMIITTLISCRLIEYGISFKKNHIPINDYLLQTLSGMTLWIYLFQYPLIYIFQYVNINKGLRMTIMIIILLCLSFILFYIFRKERKYKFLQGLLVAIIFGLTTFGAWKFCTSKDYGQEMKELEKQLEENEKKAKESQKEYEKKLNEAQEELNSQLADLDNAAANLKDIVIKLPILGIGDSIMLGAAPTLEAKFVNSHFDGKVSRQIWNSYEVIDGYKNSNTLGDPIIINLGANGNCGEEFKKRLIESFGDRDIFWATVTNDKTVKINDSIKALANEYPNLHVFDWETLSKGHSDYFAADGIHLSATGSEAYANGLYDAIYKVYEEKYKKLKEEAINKYQIESKNKYSFYGNDILLNAFDLLKSNYSNDLFNMDQSYNYRSLKNKIEKDVKENIINNKVVIAFDSNVTMNKDDYEKLIELLGNRKIYILVTTKKAVDIFDKYEKDNVTIINFYNELNKNKETYLLKDEVHLTKDGNKALVNLLDSILKAPSN